MTWRTGRHNRRIVYLQRGEQPADEDQMVAAFLDPDMAALVCSSMNAISRTLATVQKAANFIEQLPRPIKEHLNGSE